jgi:lipid A 3-O-deacylase
MLANDRHRGGRDGSELGRIAVKGFYECRGSTSGETLDHLSGAVADAAGGAVMLARAVAVAADILAGAGGSGRGLVAGGDVVVAHARPNRERPERFRSEPAYERRVCLVMNRFLTAVAAAFAATAAPASAQEVFGGVFAHDVETPLNLRGVEPGVDLQAGWRGERIRTLDFIGAPSPYAFASLNSDGDAHYAAAGISWRLGGKLYLRPALGLAVHTGPVRPDAAEPRRSLGSRILIEPELALGYRFSKRLSIEASWVHMSHARLFDSEQNPGIDNIGVRLNYRYR